MKLSRRVFDSCSVSGSKLAKVQTRALAERLCDDDQILRFEIVPRND